MINAGMAMVKNRVPLDIVNIVEQVTMGGDAWTRGSVNVAWESHGKLDVSPRFSLNSDLLLTLPTSISLNFIPIFHQG